jgi:hypothetical protein
MVLCPTHSADGSTSRHGSIRWRFQDAFRTGDGISYDLRALSQPNAFALGALAGGARIREVVTSAGCSRFRRAAQTPFNLVFEARP